MSHKGQVCGFYWPIIFQDTQRFMSKCDQRQRFGTIKRRNEMPLSTILDVKLFDIQGIDFIGPFLASYENHYVLIVVDYVSKCVEALASPTNNARVLVKFLKRFIFGRFETLRAIISDDGLYFYNHLFQKVLKKYKVMHKVTTSYHPQTSKQVQILNLEI